ncbi:peroxiredoxin [Turicibacter faecis]|uniref:thioredoxin-dependent peroxiredoxin n=1 Tax=Turicibacter faecis TaxID=2963365 RepID=A0ABM8INH8_9FIRM|nr:peroxiredoxin [Turicibacter sp. TC023]
MEPITLTEGMQAPDFTLPGSDQCQHRLKDYLGRKVILYFYPRDHTPGCTNEAKDFRDAIQSFKDQNAVILGVSRDSVQSHEKFVAKHDLPFILLSDTEETVCKQYDVLKEKNMYGKKAIGIKRSTFIIDETGMITKIFRKVRVPNHVEQVLEQCTL